jgi:hypothetical protein
MVPDPLAGLIDHTSPVSVLLPLTVALNCCDALRFTDGGGAGPTAETDSLEATVTVAEPNVVLSCWLVAFTVTVTLVGKMFEVVYFPV